ncbi:hypothetical protein BJ912DRAFT_1140960 [Pholiota molesta]|nr:hypothetical protein BJ912DRAFT_1140960 [Pholiota molesta]
MDRNPQHPKPLSYRELAKGVLYNTAQPNRSEREEYGGLDPNDSLEEYFSHYEPRGSFADLSAGHLYNPTSSAHEVDPPTWPAHGMENVGSNASPFRSYRLERPPSPVLGKRYTTTYQGRGPSHHTVASGALFNPYVRGRLPGELDTDSARLFADSSFELSRSRSQVNHVYQPPPTTSMPLKEKLGPSTSGNGRDNKDDDNSCNYSVSLGLYHSQGNLGAGGASRQFSIRSNASHLQTANPNTAQGGPSMYMHPSQSRSRTDDSIYYHPSREGTIHRAASLSHAQNTGHPSTGHARTASLSQGSMSSLGTATVSRHTPWMQQENMHAAAFDSVHPSRAHSPTDEAMHPHPSREHAARAPSSLHRSYRGDPMARGSAHPSRAPSHHGSASLRPAFADAHFPSSAHPSRVPTVIRDSVAIQEGQWGDVPPQHIPSRAPTADKGSVRAAGGSRHFQTSRTPSAATHVARFQEQQQMEGYPNTSRSPSAASRASQIQRHMGGSRMGTPAPIHEEWGTAQEHFEHFEQPHGASSRAPSALHADGPPLPVGVRAPSAGDDAASYRSRVPSEAQGAASRAGSAAGMAPSATVARRGRASKLRKGSGRAPPVTSPEPPGSASVYRISVVDPTDDGRSPIS